MRWLQKLIQSRYEREYRSRQKKTRLTTDIMCIVATPNHVFCRSEGWGSAQNGHWCLFKVRTRWCGGYVLHMYFCDHVSVHRLDSHSHVCKGGLINEQAFAPWCDEAKTLRAEAHGVGSKLAPLTFVLFMCKSRKKVCAYAHDS